MSESQKIRYKLEILTGQGVTLLLLNHDGSKGTLTGILSKIENGIVVMKSRGREIPVDFDDVLDAWPAKGRVEP